jgi:hypothetical protein
MLQCVSAEDTDHLQHILEKYRYMQRLAWRNRYHNDPNPHVHYADRPGHRAEGYDCLHAGVVHDLDGERRERDRRRSESQVSPVCAGLVSAGGTRSI